MNVVFVISGIEEEAPRKAAPPAPYEKLLHPMNNDWVIETFPQLEQRMAPPLPEVELHLLKVDCKIVKVESVPWKYIAPPVEPLQLNVHSVNFAVDDKEDWI